MGQVVAKELMAAIKVNNMQIPIDVEMQEAIDAGADPIKVMKMKLQYDADDAIAAGADSNLVNQALQSDLKQITLPKKPSVGQSISAGVGAGLAGLGATVRYDLPALLADVLKDKGAAKELRSEKAKMFESLRNLPAFEQSPTATNIGQTIGQEALPAAASMAAPLGGTASLLKGAGKLGALGAASGFARDPGQVEDPMGARLGQAVTGGVTGAAFGAVTGIPGSLVGLSKNPAVQRFTSKIPFVGTKGYFTEQAKEINRDVLKLMDDVRGHPEVKDLRELESHLYREVEAKVGDQVIKREGADKLITKAKDMIKLGRGPTDLNPAELSAMRELERFEREAPMNYMQTRALKERVADSIYNPSTGIEKYSKLGNIVERTELSVLDNAAHQAAKTVGMGNQYLAAKAVTQERVAYEKLTELWKAAPLKGTSDDVVDLNKWANGAKKYLSKEGSKRMPPLLRNKVTKTLTGLVETIKRSPIAVETLAKQGRLMSFANMTTAIAGGGLGYAMGMTPKTILLSMAGGTYVMSALIKHPQLALAFEKLGGMSPTSMKFKQLSTQVIEGLVNNMGQEAPAEQEPTNGTPL